MPEDEFERYLTLLARTLRLSNAQRDAIASELSDHMEQRLDELTEQGLSRGQAIKTALAEFGDASALANDLTRNNPVRVLKRRHLMQTTFGTLIACAAVTFAVMLLTPNNKDGQPNQSGAIAQGGGFGEAAPRGGDMNKVIPGGMGRGIAQADKLDLTITVVDCSDILQPDRNHEDLLERTTALANALEKTVAAVCTHGGEAVHIQPFDSFLIITATMEAHDKLEFVLDDLRQHVAHKQARQEEREAQARHRQQAERNRQVAIERLTLSRQKLQDDIRLVDERVIQLNRALQTNRDKFGPEHTNVKQIEDQLEAHANVRAELRSEVESTERELKMVRTLSE